MASPPDQITDLATRPDLAAAVQELRAGLHREIGGLAWKVAGLLLAQGATIVALLKAP